MAVNHVHNHYSLISVIVLSRLQDDTGESSSQSSSSQSRLPSDKFSGVSIKVVAGFNVRHLRDPIFVIEFLHLNLQDSPFNDLCIRLTPDDFTCVGGKCF